MAAGRKDANFSQGWGFAAFVTAMAVGAFVLAGTIKSRTYIPPTDPMAPGSEAPAHGAEGAAAGEAKDAAAH